MSVRQVCLLGSQFPFTSVNAACSVIHGWKLVYIPVSPWFHLIWSTVHLITKSQSKALELLGIIGGQGVEAELNEYKNTEVN
jgi:hypothetical protein